MCHQFICADPPILKVPIDERGKVNWENGRETDIDKFAIGALTGLEMAIDQVKENHEWFHDFQIRDLVTIECIGTIHSDKLGYSDMVEFKIAVQRD